MGSPVQLLVVGTTALGVYAAMSGVADALVLEPTFFAVFYWKNSLHFVLGLLGVFLLVLVRLLKVYRPLAPEQKKFRLLRASLLGLALGLAFAAISAGRINRPVPLAWFEPSPGQTHAGAPGTKLSEDRQDSEPVHDHGGTSGDGKLFGGKLVELDLKARLHARKLKRPILYYFRADWCPNCPDFERYVLGSPVFAAALRDFVLVKMDVTDFETVRAYVDRKYGVHGTPTVVFRDRSGRIMAGATVNGAHVSYRLFGRLLDAARESRPER